MKQNALMELPRCPIHGEQLVLRQLKNKDLEFLGAWYDCPKCGYSVLIPSKELAAIYAKQNLFLQ